MRKTPANIESQIIKDRNAGVPNEEILRRYSIGKTTLNRIVNRNDVAKRVTLIKESEHFDEIVSAYKSGESIKSMMSRIGVSKKHVLEVMRLSNESDRRNTRKEFNADAFKPDKNGNYSSEQIYWGGFLLADGCVQIASQGSPVLRLCLKACDIEHLEAFRDFVESTHAITVSKDKKKAEISIRCQNWLEDLIPFGVVPKKSLIAQVPEKFIFNKHYWRGVLDGDGWILPAKKWSVGGIGLCGAHHVVESFREYLAHLGVESLPSARRRHSISSFEIRGKKSIQAIKEIYCNQDICLRRKQERALAVVKACDPTAIIWF